MPGSPQMIGPVCQSTRVALAGRRACRCSPFEVAAGTRGSAPGATNRASRRASARRRSCCTRPSAADAAAADCVPAARCGSARPSHGSRPACRGSVGADGDHGGQADGRVHRVAAADPVPEAEHVGGVDAELRRPPRYWSTRATKCLATAASEPSLPTSHVRAVAALVIVSRVVKVLEADDEQRLAGIQIAASPR